MKKALVMVIAMFTVLSEGFLANAQAESTTPDPEISTPYHVVKTFLTAYIAGDHEKFVSLTPMLFGCNPVTTGFQELKNQRRNCYKWVRKWQSCLRVRLN